MEDNNKKNESLLDFDLDEITASLTEKKDELSAALDSIFVPSESASDTKVSAPDTLKETGPNDSEAAAEVPSFDMTPSEHEKKAESEAPNFVLAPSEPEPKTEVETEAPSFDMTPEAPKERIEAAPSLDMTPSEKVEPSETLSKEMTRIVRDPSYDESITTNTNVADDTVSRVAVPSSSKQGATATINQQVPAPAGGSYAGSASASQAGSVAKTHTGSNAGSAANVNPTSAATAQAGSGKHDVANTKKQKEKKYVSRGGLVAAMVVTMLLSTLLGTLIGSGINGGNNYSDNRAERDDSKLSQLNLSDATGSELTVAQIVDKNEDAVVEIVVSGTTQGMWGQMQLTEGAGSGVIIRKDGYIATNYHVIQGANRVQVTLHNGEVYPATIVGSDSDNDVAVIKIDENNLTTVEIGDSSTVDVGDLAVAIGNPLGQLGGTATTGIISALDRTLNVEGTTLTLLQTDAAINGGNSGGGLFNSRGELIGIVESKASAVGVEGLAFALPINSVAEIINNIIESGGNVEAVEAGTPAVGIVISDVSEEQSQYYGLEEPGVYVAQVTGRNAMRAGFQEQDRIVSFNGTKIDNSSEFITLVRKCKVGDTVSVVVSRNGQEIEIKTELEELQTNQ